MCRVAQQPVALARRLGNEAEFAVLQIAQPAMRHAGGGAAGARAAIFPIDDQAAHALQGKVAERGAAVDAAADDQYIHVGGLAEMGETFIAIGM